MSRRKEEAIEGAGYRLIFTYRPDQVTLECVPRRGIPYLTTQLTRADAIDKAWRDLIMPKPIDQKDRVAERDPERIKWMERIQQEAHATLKKWGVPDATKAK
jgi:hypothetical protein